MASRFLGFCVFQVFQDFSATFFTMILVRGGRGHFSILKAKQSSETPPCLELRPPHEGKFASKTPQMGGTPGFFFILLFFRVFSF